MRQLSRPSGHEPSAKRLSVLLGLNLRLRGETLEPGRFPGLRARPARCVARDGRIVAFAAPGDIPAALRGCVERFHRELSEGTAPLPVAYAAARFWLAFIAIHPFEDGNGRTAKAYLRLALEPVGFSIPDFALVDRYLIEGPADVERLTWLFLVSLKGGRA